VEGTGAEDKVPVWCVHTASRPESRQGEPIISLTSAAIHVVTICQSLGIPALLSLEKNGVELRPDGRLVNSAGREIQERDWITLSSRRETLYQGEAKFAPGRLLRYIKRESVQLLNIE
jgi:hypothetical protein